MGWLDSAWDYAKQHPLEIAGTAAFGPLGYLGGAAIEEMTGGRSAIRDIADVAGDVVRPTFTPTTQTTTQAPWAPQEPFIQKQFAEAERLYNQPGSLVPGPSDQTQQWLNAQMAAAGNNPYLAQFGQGVTGLTNYRNPYLSQFGGIGGEISRLGGEVSRLPTMPNQAMGGLMNVQGIDPSLLRETATGGFLGSNPYLDAMYQRAAGQVGEQFKNITMPGITSTFAQAGRFGSPAQQEAMRGAEDVLAKNLGGLATDIYGGAYGAERSLQEGARQNLANLGISTRGQDVNRFSSMGNIYNQALNNMLQGLNIRSDIYGRQADIYGKGADIYGKGADIQLRAFETLPSVREMQTKDLGLMQDVGSYYDQLAKQQAMEDWNRLGLYQGAITGNYGGTTTAPGPTPWEQVMSPVSDAAQIALPFVLNK